MSQRLWIAFFMLWWREIWRFQKVVFQTVVAPLIGSFLYLLIFGVNLGSYLSDVPGGSYLAFILPGLVAMSVVNNAFMNSSSCVVSAKFCGELEEFRWSMMTGPVIVGALSLGALTRGFVVGGLIVLMGQIFSWAHFGHFIEIQNPLWFLVFLILAGLAFGMLGLCVAFWAKSFDQVSAFSSFVLLPFVYLGGVFVPIQKLSGFWQDISSLNPMLYFISGARYGMIGVNEEVPVSLMFVVAAASVVLFYFLARWSVARGSYNRW